jgi:uncharacterized OB-fold protein
MTITHPATDAPAPPTFTPDDLSAPFWDALREGRFVLQRCQDCGLFIHFPRPICRRCQSFRLAYEQVSGAGTVYSFTETHRGLTPYFATRTPYLLAAIELQEQPGLRMLSNLVDIAEPDVRFGMPVQVRFEQLTPEITLPVFAPAGAGR